MDEPIRQNSTDDRPHEKLERVRLPKGSGPTVGELMDDPELYAKYVEEHGDPFASISSKIRESLNNIGRSLSVQAPDYGYLANFKSPSKLQEETTYAVQNLGRTVSETLEIQRKQHEALLLMLKGMEQQTTMTRWVLGISGLALLVGIGSLVTTISGLI
jgi:hypothetical protein